MELERDTAEDRRGVEREEQREADTEQDPLVPEGREVWTAV
ncbi:hypothetical protein ACIQ7Q_07470 [Streptomyces sp. NPDC096176]